MINTTPEEEGLLGEVPFMLRMDIAPLHPSPSFPLPAPSTLPSVSERCIVSHATEDKREWHWGGPGYFPNLISRCKLHQRYKAGTTITASIIPPQKPAGP